MGAGFGGEGLTSVGFRESGGLMGQGFGRRGSTGNSDCFFKVIPKTTLNQHLLNPIKPKKLAEYNKNIVDKGAEHIKPENI